MKLAKAIRAVEGFGFESLVIAYGLVMSAVIALENELRIIIHAGAKWGGIDCLLVFQLLFVQAGMPVIAMNRAGVCLLLID